MDQKLSDLVDKVEGEASKYASFDDYLASRTEGTEWQKSASDVVENSSPVSSEKVVETAASSPSTSAASASPVTKEEHPHARLTPTYIENGHKVEPAHPIVPPVDHADVPPEEVPTANSPFLMAKVKLTDPINWDGQVLRSIEEEISTVKPGEEPDWWKNCFLLGEQLGEALEKDPEGWAQAIANRINILREECERRRRTEGGLRKVLAKALSKATNEQAARAKKTLDQGYRLSQNKAAAERMKAERASQPKASTKKAEPKSGIGIKFADQMALGMGMRGDELIEFVEKAGKLDEATATHIRTKWGA